MESPHTQVVRHPLPLASLSYQICTRFNVLPDQAPLQKQRPVSAVSVISSSKMNLVQSSYNEVGKVFVLSHHWIASLNIQTKKFLMYVFLADGSIAACQAAKLEGEITTLSLPSYFPTYSQMLQSQLQWT
ncbi:hypothetical protein ElyMa_000237000 [Elysia marginata]|uniref:Uncharacterized protein n=1 Tax=Elysia marginata TaxID=1093978 RepID=A0AAV4F1K6_9GAST|nr:hypothetical protein ElyMa_000237000 [Elysia marginata]